MLVSTVILKRPLLSSLATRGLSFLLHLGCVEGEGL